MACIWRTENFGLTDHQVDLNNVTMVRQYQRVYQATDYYIIGGKEMGTCFKESFEATEDQLLPLGLPRLSQYLKFNLKAEQERLKSIIIFIKNWWSMFPLIVKVLKIIDK